MKRGLCLLLALMLIVPVCAAAEGVDALEEQIDQVLGTLDFSGLESLDIPGFDQEMRIESLVRVLASGQTVSPGDCVSRVIGAFFDALSELGALMVSIMLPVLLSGIMLHTFASGRGLSGSLSRNVCTVIILIPVLLLVFSQLEHAKQTITVMTDRMDKLLPMLLTLLTALGGSASSAFLHPMVVAASGSMVFLAREVILRLVMCTCAVTAVNHLCDRAHLTRMAQLLRSGVCWLLGVSFTVFLGAMSLQGVCSASIDGVVLRAAKYAVDNFVPVVGGMFSDTMDTLVGCTLIVKNALGVAAVFVLLGAILAPLMRTLAVVFVIKLSAALLEPVAEAEIIRAIGDFSRTIVLFLITMLCVGTMYFLLIVQMLLVGNLTVMLR